MTTAVQQSERAAEVRDSQLPSESGVGCMDLLDDGLSAVVRVLCEWAWGKVYLDITNKLGCPLLINAARIEYRRALRVKKQLDSENQHTDHLTLDDVGLAPRQGELPMSSNDQAQARRTGGVDCK